MNDISKSSESKMQLVLVLTVQLVLLLSQNVTSSNPISESPEINVTTLIRATGTTKEAGFFGQLWKDVEIYSKKMDTKLKEWGQKIREHTKAVDKYTCKKIQEMKHFLEKYFQMGKNVQICLKKQHAELDEVTRLIFEGVVTCLSSGLGRLNQIELGKPNLILNETAYVRNVENNLEKCIDDGVSQIECIRRVREKTLDNIHDMEKEILDDMIEKRNVMNDLLESIAECSVEGLINASAAITNTTINVIHCVRELNNSDVRTLVCV